ncbi:hypothetical protein ACTMU2_37130 [Cupriavidus basilensis]
MPDAESARHGACGRLPKSASLAWSSRPPSALAASSCKQGLLFSAETRHRAFGIAPGTARRAVAGTSAAPLPVSQPEQLSPTSCASAPAQLAAQQRRRARPDRAQARPARRCPAVRARPTRPPRPSPSYDEAEMLKITPRQYEVLVLLMPRLPDRNDRQPHAEHLRGHGSRAFAHARSTKRLKVRNKGEAVYAALARGDAGAWWRATERVDAGQRHAAPSSRATAKRAPTKLQARRSEPPASALCPHDKTGRRCPWNPTRDRGVSHVRQHFPAHVFRVRLHARQSGWPAANATVDLDIHVGAARDPRPDDSSNYDTRQMMREVYGTILIQRPRRTPAANRKSASVPRPARMCCSVDAQHRWARPSLQQMAERIRTTISTGHR